MHDGPGIRTTVFLKGCPLRCAWCHNPETQDRRTEIVFYPNKCIGCGACEKSCPSGTCQRSGKYPIERVRCRLCEACVQECPTGALSLCGKERSIGEILDEIERDRAFFCESGGVTLSGGEPFAQGEAVIELLRACKKRGISTAVETCGYVDLSHLLAAMPYVDLFLWDIKDTDDARHKRYTGVSVKRILQNLREIAVRGARIRLRCILVRGVNTEDAHYERVAALAREISNLDGVEPIAYHAYAGSKAVFLGREDNGHPDWIPDEEQLDAFRGLLREADISVY